MANNSRIVRISVILRFVRENYFNSDEEESFEEVIPKIVGFAEDIVPYMSDQQFKMHFRMSPITFEALLKLIFSTTKPTMAGRPQTEVEKQIMITVWFLANLECIRSIASRFGVSKSTCWASINRGCKLLLEVNKKFKIICWPTMQQAEDISLSIEQLYNLPGVIGVVDGTHIPIAAPTNHKMSYFNRNSYFSVVLQGVCDNKKMFTDVYAGQSGSVHDNNVYEKSDLYRRINNHNPVLFPNNCHIVGDLAYKLSSRLLVGFKNNGRLTRRQKNFNFILSRTRILIEHTFGLLKGRFRRLKLLETRKMDLIPLIIVSACILHNICILNNDTLENLNVEQEVEHLREEDMGEVYADIFDDEAREKRTNIMMNLPVLLRDDDP